jgi:Zn-dependent protease
MDNPFAFSPDKPVITLAHIFGTPIGIQGKNWLPVNQLFLWTLFSWLSIKKYPSWSKWKHFWVGGLKMVVVLGSEWCHNIAHAAAAHWVGRPVDEMRIIAGMPLLIYHEPEHVSVTPRQHILRSVAGPACNAVLLLFSKIFQRSARSASAAREVADAAVSTNAFIASAALLPVSVFDGGPILKWSLISKGYTPAQSAAVIYRTNLVLGTGLIGAAAVSIQRRKWLLAYLFSFLGLLALAAGSGKIKGLAA